MSYSNLSNPANYQLQSFGQDGMRTISTSQAYVEGEYYRVLVATEDSTLSATSVVGDNLSSINVYAGATIYGLFTSVTVTSGEITAYLAGRTDIEDVWAYVEAYGLSNGATIEAVDEAQERISPLLDKYYAKASLSLAPSMYDTGVVYAERPLDSNGQITFDRASTATRVNADGLVEKVRSNIILQSNQFDTTWSLSNATANAGQVGYDGSNDAWELNTTGVSVLSYVYQTQSTPLVRTMSVYAKAGTVPYMGLWSGSSSYGYFDLSDGTLGVISGPLAISHSITSVGNGWYRCEFTVDTPATNFYILLTDTPNGSYSSDGNTIYIQDAQVEVGDIATDYIPTTTAAVSVGPVANLPRLDYGSGASRPSLLIELPRTNLVTYSEQFDNAAWVKTNTTITANAAISPDGYQNSDKIIPNATSSSHSVYQAIGSIGDTGIVSCFVKRGEYRYVSLTYGAIGASSTARFDFDTLTFSGGANTGYQSFGNGWYRIYAMLTSTVNNRISLIIPDDNGNYTYAGDGVGGTYAWGLQYEASLYYPTSYIPTYGTSVTRLVDKCYKSSASNIIGQDEWTLFIDYNYLINGNHWLATFGDDQAPVFDFMELTQYAVGADYALYFAMYSSGSTVWEVTLNFGPKEYGKRYKVAIAYRENDFAIYVDGQLMASQSSGTSPLFSELGLGGIYNMDVIDEVFVGLNLNNYLLFKTRLSNTELSELTTL